MRASPLVGPTDLPSGAARINRIRNAFARNPPIQRSDLVKAVVESGIDAVAGPALIAGHESAETLIK